MRFSTICASVLQLLQALKLFMKDSPLTSRVLLCIGGWVKVVVVSELKVVKGAGFLGGVERTMSVCPM